MKTRDVVFYSEGAKMAGTIYLPTITRREKNGLPCCAIPAGPA